MFFTPVVSKAPKFPSAVLLFKIKSRQNVCSRVLYIQAILCVLVKIYNCWHFTPTFYPCYDPYDFQRFYIFFSSDVLHKITHHLPFKGDYTNLHLILATKQILPLLSPTTSGLLRDHTPLPETKTDMFSEILVCKTMENQAVGVHNTWKKVKS